VDGFDEAIFDRAAQLVESGWSQGVSARSDDGTVCRWESPDAKAFCAMGAVARALHESGWWCPETQSAALVLLQQRVARLGGKSTPKWNDDQARTREEVVAMLRNHS